MFEVEVERRGSRRKKRGQSPERGRLPVRDGATNDWLAGAATMLTHGVLRLITAPPLAFRPALPALRFYHTLALCASPAWLLPEWHAQREFFANPQVIFES